MNQFLSDQHATDIQRGTFVGRPPLGASSVEFNAHRWNQFWQQFFQDLEEVEPHAQIQSTFEAFAAATSLRVVPFTLQKPLSAAESDVIGRTARTFGATALVRCTGSQEDALIEFTTSRSAFLLYHYFQSLLFLADPSTLTNDERLVKQSVRMVSLPHSDSGAKYGSTIELTGAAGRPLDGQLLPYLDALFRLFQKGDSTPTAAYQIQFDPVNASGGRYRVQYTTLAEAFEALQFLQAPLAMWFGMVLSLVPQGPVLM